MKNGSSTASNSFTPKASWSLRKADVNHRLTPAGWGTSQAFEEENVKSFIFYCHLFYQMNVQCLSVLQDGGMLQQIFPASLLKLASADVNVLFARPARGYLINSRPMPECEKHNPQPRMWGSLCSQEAGNYLCSVSLRAKKKGEKNHPCTENMSSHTGRQRTALCSTSLVFVRRYILNSPEAPRDVHKEIPQIQVAFWDRRAEGSITTFITVVLLTVLLYS